MKTPTTPGRSSWSRGYAGLGMTAFALLDIDPRFMLDSDGNVYGPNEARSAVRGRYQAVSIKGHGRYVHRLMAETFIPNPEKKPDVAHRDNNGLNNAVSNLRWSTVVENMADKRVHGTHNGGARHPLAKLTQADVDFIRSCKGLYRGVQSDLAEMYEMSGSTINTIIHRKHWKE